MASDVQNTKNELLAIFPQHNEETITRIYNSVVENVGSDSHVLVLPICIEQLLELPANTRNEQNNIVSDNPFANNGPNIFNRPPHAVPPIAIPPGINQKKDNPFRDIPGLDQDSDDSNDSYDSPSSDEECNIDHENYRNRARPMYRDHEHDSRSRSRSISPQTPPPFNESLGGYFSDSNDSIFADLDNDLSGLQGFVKAPTKSENNVITIKDSPLINRKRKLNDVAEIGSNSNLVDLTKIKNDNHVDDESTIKKIILKEDIIDGLANTNFSSEKPDISTVKKGMTGYMDLAKENVKAVIHDVDNIYLENLINGYVDTPASQVVQRIVEHLLDHSDYPKITKTLPQQPTTQAFKSSSTITSSMSTFQYNQQAVILLQNSFPKVSTKVLRKVFTETRNYTKAFDTIETALKSICSGEKKAEETIIVSFLKGCRNKIKINDMCSTLTDEIKGMENRRKEEMEKGDWATASALNSKQYDEEGQTIECGCCYNEVAFDDMVQCLDGHLFCVTCLQSYSKEAVYGSGKAQLFCMTDGCDSTFPLSQMKKALEGDLLEKYMERVQDEDIKLANLSNLIRCPGCDFAAEMDDGDKVFRCQNTSCLKETCRYCKEEWKDHFGVPCKELEKKEAKNLRTSYEEKMTEAKVRKCWQCSTIFLKSDGCNKMTCRCGAKMCYICRKPKINYDHFCQHPRNPGEGCTQCKKCNLWTDPSEDDDRAVAEIKKQAEEERKKLAGEDDCSKTSIGPVITVASSSTITKPFHQRPHPRQPNPHHAGPAFQRHANNAANGNLYWMPHLEGQQFRFQGNW